MIDYQAPDKGALEKQARKLMRQAELVREENVSEVSPELSFGLYNRAVALVFKEGLDLLIARDAYAQMFVCAMHQYQSAAEANRPVFLEKMQQCLNLGFALAIPDEEKHVFYLRQGDLKVFKGEISAAIASYETALNLAPSDHAILGEYYGYLAKAHLANGDYQLALVATNSAYLHVNDAVFSEDRFWHKLTIISGIVGRRAKAFWGDHQYVLAAALFAKTYYLALKLKFIYGKPKRLEQFHQALLGNSSY